MILTAILWSSSGLVIKVMHFQALSILSARSVIAAIVFAIYLSRTGQLRWKWTPLQVIAAVGNIGTQLTFIMATKLTTAANAIFLEYTAPVYIVIFAYLFLKERPQRADWIAMVVIFAGMFLFFGDRLSLSGLYGNLLAILSGVLMAVMMISMRAQKDGIPAQSFLLGNFIGIAIGIPSLLHETWTPPDVGMILYLGIFQIGISSVLYAIAIKHVPALEASLILTLEPIFNPVWVFLVLGEKPGPLALIGAFLVLGAVTGRAIVGAQSNQGESAPTG
jgi:drug/metabolite transporter (DMT)-like permease